MKKWTAFFAATLVTAALLLFAAGCAAPEETVSYITDRAGLMKALADRTERIYLGDMVLDEKDIYIQLSQSVTFVGKPEGSVIRNARFSLVGPEVESELLTISYENLIFDGGYVMPEGDPNEAASFAAFHGDRTDMGCVYAQGYLDLSFLNCQFRHYCAKFGPGMYLNYTDGNKDIGTRASLTVKGCRFTDNVCERGVLWCNGKNTRLTLEDTLFENNALNSGVVVLGGVKGTVEGLTVQNNPRVTFTEKNSYPSLGGALSLVRSEATVKNSRFIGSAAVSGGGATVSASRATFDSCLFENNLVDETGGAMRLQSSEADPIYVTNCTFRGNRAKEEGAIYVMPADQIGVGLPTGITEFSFCSFEDNRSEEGETFIFHPVQTENPDSTVGRAGSIDVIACRIRDGRVTPALKNGENYNIVNSDEKGEPVPEEAVALAANGYYGETRQKMYPGVNEPEKQTPSLGLILSVALGALAVIGGAVLLIRRKSARRPAPAAPLPTPDPVSGPDRLETLIRERNLTGREAEVLREYLSGKSRGEIAAALFISESTVKNHVSNIFAKCGVRSKRELEDLLRRGAE